MFWPMFAMFVWIMLVMQRTAFLRVSSIRSGAVKMSYFRIFQGEAPEKLVQHGNHFNNLQQMPILFFIISLFIEFSKITDITFVVLAYSFVGLRIGHSIVHLSYNKVPHRFAFFLLSNIAIALMWIRTAVVLG